MDAIGVHLGLGDQKGIFGRKISVDAQGAPRVEVMNRLPHYNKSSEQLAMYFYRLLDSFIRVSIGFLTELLSFGYYARLVVQLPAKNTIRTTNEFPKICPDFR